MKHLKNNSSNITKVAVMTFHMASNYGAMLQAYALQKTIDNMEGVECEILDYRQHFIYKRDGIYRFNELILDSGALKGSARFIWRHLEGRYRNITSAQKKFDDFLRNDQECSQKVYFKKEKLKKTSYDVVVFGSDQIWNPNLIGGFSPEYLGGGFDTNKTSLVAYAASCGTGHLPEEYQNQYIYYLRRFSAISVREKSLANTLNEDWHISVQTTLDPVLLAKPAIWEPLIKQAEIHVNEPYLLIYSFDAGDEIYKVALKVAQVKHLKPIAICYKKQNISPEIEQILDCGPKDFLSLISHAEFVCTTSFHGLAFSILFGKQFYCMPHPLVGQRERDLIDLLGLNDRFLEHSEDLINITDGDYSEAQKRLEDLRESSLRFLEDAIWNKGREDEPNS